MSKFTAGIEAQLSNLVNFILVVGIILVIDFVIYRTCLHIYTQIYGRAEARQRAYGVGWIFKWIAMPVAIWLFFIH
ncbi:hypothetical protein LST1_06840 [Neisseria elongata]|uniref:hypothetical protein n=1 Tax=Neisseria elongata TaxID=495 RepID=UPI002852DDAF|nr:hypothetical protein LST1_06840 [Neisseria elongata]